MKLVAETWKVVLAVVLVQVIIIAWIIVFWQYRAYLQARTLAELTLVLHDAELKTYERQVVGDFGGSMPVDTLNMYIGAVERGDYKVASTYFVRGARQQELHRFVGVDIIEVREFSGLLKQAGALIAEIRPESDKLENSFPLSFTMKRTDSGVWQFETINYQLSKKVQ